MIPNTGTAVIIIVAFLLPGFVTVLLQERTFKSADDPTTLDRLLRIFWYSAWSYLLVAVVAIILRVDRSDIVDTYRDHRGDPALLVVIGALVVLIPSMVINEVTRRWDKSQRRVKVLNKLGLNVRHTEPTAWDHFMRQRRDAYVRATFANGTRILGYYGANSFAAYAKDGQDLYLEQVFTPNNPDDEWFGELVPRSSGVWVKAAEAVSVEFYTPVHDGQETEPESTTAQGDGEEGRTSRAAPQADSTSATAASTAPEEEGLEDEQDRGI